MSIVTFVALVISGLGSGVLSDRLGRRKPLVFVASLVMAAAVATPLIVPTIHGMMAYAVLPIASCPVCAPNRGRTSLPMSSLSAHG
ncbi:MAG: hypothetical protein ACJ8R9_01040 [Steroidobacteraceae bacterium]